MVQVVFASAIWAIDHDTNLVVQLHTKMIAQRTDEGAA
jgi:hypothetical protein